MKAKCKTLTGAEAAYMTMQDSIEAMKSYSSNAIGKMRETYSTVIGAFRDGGSSKEYSLREAEYGSRHGVLDDSDYEIKETSKTDPDFVKNYIAEQQKVLTGSYSTLEKEAVMV